jgi:PAS domain S-box-containing protein
MKRSEITLALGITLIYFLVAETWDVLSDLFFTSLNLPPQTLSSSLIWKDLIFSILTGLLLFFILYREFNSIKKTENALRESEDRFRSLYENSPDGILLTKPDGEILAANPAACGMLGWSEAAIRQVRRNDFLDSSDPQLKSALQAGQPLEQGCTDWIVVRKDGSRFPAEVTSAQFSDKNGNPRASLIVRDISQRKQIENTLIEREAHLRMLVEKMPALLWTTDLNLRYTYSAGTILAHFGLRPDQMIGRLIGSTAAKGDPSAAFTVEQHRQVLQEGLPVSYDLHWIDHFLHMEVEPLRDSSGAIVGAIGAALDISDRVKAYQLLEQRVEERTREIERRSRVAEGLREIVAILNSNRPLEEILNFILGQASHILQADSAALYLPENEEGQLSVQAATGWDAEIQKTLKFEPGEGPADRAVKQGKPVVIPDVRLAMRSDGADPHTRTLETLWQSAGDGSHGELTVPLILNGKPHGAIRLTYLDNRDLTDEQVNLAVSLADQAALAIENSRLHGQVEQLAVLNERNRLARELHDSVTQAIYSLTLMAEAGRRMLDMNEIAVVKNLLGRLALTAQQSLKEIRLLVYELRPGILQTAGLVGAIQQRLDAVEKRAGLETRLLVNGPVEMPSHVEEALYRIIQEALNNSLKHAWATQVQVNLRTDGMTVEMEIKDNGQGFDPAILKNTGGLGLASMRERVERLGGTLDIQSAPGQGMSLKISACRI